MKWEWRGQPLAHPLVILRRLIGLAILTPALWLAFLGILFGWGLWDAKDFWRHRP